MSFLFANSVTNSQLNAAVAPLATSAQVTPLATSAQLTSSTNSLTTAIGNVPALAGMVLKAFVLFETGAGTIYKQFNVSSVVKNQAGQYAVSFTSALATATYQIVNECINGNGAVGNSYTIDTTSKSAAGITLNTRAVVGGTLGDYIPLWYVAFYG